MDPCSLFLESKWKILKEISKKNQSPADIATKLNTTIANINQQIKLLEAYGFLKKEKQETSRKPGKPKTIYSIAKDVYYVLGINNELAEKKQVKPTIDNQIMMNILLADLKEESYFIGKFFFNYETIIRDALLIAYYKSDESQVELFVISEKLEELRTKYANVVIESLDKKQKKIVLWSHSLEEVEEGIKNNEEHFLNLVKNSRTLSDINSKGILVQLQEKVQ
jgi:predicted transcriptional regulator